MVDDTLVTVCINNYNYGAFVGSAVDSCLEQTHPAVEVVVVDDGSTDHSREVLDGYGDRIRTIYQPNAGQSAAVNAGFAAASGDVVILLDADDLLLPDTVARAVAAFAEDERVVRVQWLLELVDDEGRRTGRIIPPPGWRLPTGDLSDVALRYRTYVWNPTSASAYRSSALRHVLPMPERTYLPNTGPDLYLSETVVLLGHVAALEDVGGLYRVHSSNFTTTSRRDEVAFLRTKVEEIVAGQRHVHELARRRGLDAPVDPREARDWAFAAYRIALLRMAPSEPVLQEDTLPALALQGVRSALSHPHMAAAQRYKRAGWFVAMAVAPERAVRFLIAQLLHTSPERRLAAEQLNA